MTGRVAGSVLFNLFSIFSFVLHISLPEIFISSEWTTREITRKGVTKPEIVHVRYIFKNSNMTPRGNCKFFTTPLPGNSQKRLEYKENQTKYRKITRKPQSHVRMLINISKLGYSPATRALLYAIYVSWQTFQRPNVLTEIYTKESNSKNVTKLLFSIVFHYCMQFLSYNICISMLSLTVPSITLSDEVNAANKEITPDVKWSLIRG